MNDRRRHQRVRFGEPPTVKLGMPGRVGEGLAENISLSGLMLRTDLPLLTGHVIGCEFSLGDAFPIDVPATVVSRVGDLYCVRFQPGGVSEVAIEDGIIETLERGLASVITVHERAGKRVMRISGGLNSGLANDFMHSLTRVGVDEIDLSEVTAVDAAGVSLCTVASLRHKVVIGAQSACFAAAWKARGN